MSLAGWFFLLLIVAVIGVIVWRRRPPGYGLPGRRPAAGPTTPAADDLTTLGLSEVRVRGTESAGPPPPATRARPAEPRAVAPATPPESRRAVRKQTARSTPGTYVRTGTTLWATEDRSAGLLLASLAEHLGGPAAVLRHDAEADAYVVEALAGTPVDEAPASIAADDSRLPRAPQDRMVTLLPADGLRALGIDRKGTVYVRALGEPPADRVFLVVSASGGEPEREAMERLGRYADLLADLTEIGDAPATPSGDAEPAPVPRAAIIHEEQEAARAEGRPLAFALVTLADAESLLAGAPGDLAGAERELHDRLREAKSVRRVEPFGDLLFGAFLDLDPAGTADWCDALASGDPPLFIGAVAPADAEPEAIRAAAADALRDAYDQRRTQIVEA